MKTTNSTKDIPLSHAMIAWNEVRHGHDDYDGRVKVVLWPDTTDQCRGFICTSGACGAKWHDLNTREQMAALLLCAMETIVFDGLNPRDVHNALLVIPEYRKVSFVGKTHPFWD